MKEYLDLLMVLALILCLLGGYPVAWTLGGVATIFGIIGFGFDFFMFLPLRLWGRMTNFTLVAVPLFVYMGVVLERSGLAEDLLKTMGDLFGRLRGGLAISIVMVGAVLGASTGVVGATVVTMGVISLPVMLRSGYSAPAATGVISASGTLGQIIPPSIILVILGDIMGVSVGELFAGALIPGFVLVGCYIAYIVIYGYFRPEHVPAAVVGERAKLGKSGVLRVIGVLLPPALLVLAVLGSILGGIASPTEAAGVGAFGALLLALAKRKLTWAVLKESMVTTTRLSSMVFIILLAATSFGLVFRGLGGEQMVKDFFQGIGGGEYVTLAVVMLVLFVLGFVLDVIEITFIVIPMLTPVFEDMGFNMLWMAVLIAVNFQTSFLTPPMGFSLFYLRGVSPPDVTTSHIYRGVVPYVALQLVGLAIVILFPSTVTWLPSVVFK
ncbi:MAG: TRAP transporter large permease subunit [Deltaproteobacteria bacterium]|nr:TRAP transporter large permease subunit [Deltaproteobacteria bacterium]